MAAPVDVVIVGQNLNSFGLVGLENNISGIGLVTHGFLFPCQDIWTNVDLPRSTVWVDCPRAVNTSEVCVE
jgi:hypothetical protein